MTAISIAIVGGGWAGLSCAVELARLGYAITLFEAAQHLGGRARRIAYAEQQLDNGQHLLLGAYRNTLNVLTQIGVDLDAVFHREPLRLEFIDAQQIRILVTTPRIFAPLHLLSALFTAKGLTLKDRLRAAWFGARLWSNRIVLQQDISVSELLQREKQSATLVQALWAPLCLAALTTPIERASAQVFIRVLRDAFCRARADSDTLWPRCDLGAVFPDPAAEYIQQHGGTLRLGHRVDRLLVNQNRVQGVRARATEFAAEHVILAVPPNACLSLLQAHPIVTTISAALREFCYEPICTIYIQYPVQVRLDTPMLGMLGHTIHWIIDRRFTQQPGLIAAVISSREPSLDLTHDALADQVCDELQRHFPHWPKPRSRRVICEKRAAFSCRVGINTIRPNLTTPLAGLWLCGDYTNTGYPATIEGAVQSGLRCAQSVHQHIINKK